MLKHVCAGHCKLLEKLSRVQNTQLMKLIFASRFYQDILADEVEDPSRVMGTHFFSPANVMKLLVSIERDELSP